jgi:sRNA-binding regulator protein Hfq
MYTVVADGKTLRCIDAESGVPVNTYTVNGDITSGPIVTGDRATVVVRKGGINQGLVFKIPTLYVVSTFKG